LPGVPRTAAAEVAGVAAHGPLPVHAELTHLPLSGLAGGGVADRPRAVRRIRLALGIRGARAARVRRLRAAQAGPPARPLQSVLVPWQLPAGRSLEADVAGAVLGSAVHCASVEQPPHGVGRRDAAQLPGRTVAR
jgi:hypothetical protein